MFVPEFLNQDMAVDTIKIAMNGFKIQFNVMTFAAGFKTLLTCQNRRSSDGKGDQDQPANQPDGSIFYPSRLT